MFPARWCGPLTRPNPPGESYGTDSYHEIRGRSEIENEPSPWPPLSPLLIPMGLASLFMNRVWLFQVQQMSVPMAKQECRRKSPMKLFVGGEDDPTPMRETLYRVSQKSGDAYSKSEHPKESPVSNQVITHQCILSSSQVINWEKGQFQGHLSTPPKRNSATPCGPPHSWKSLEHWRYPSKPKYHRLLPAFKWTTPWDGLCTWQQLFVSIDFVFPPQTSYATSLEERSSSPWSFSNQGHQTAWEGIITKKEKGSQLIKWKKKKECLSSSPSPHRKFLTNFSNKRTTDMGIEKRDK